MSRPHFIHGIGLKVMGNPSGSNRRHQSRIRGIECPVARDISLGFHDGISSLGCNAHGIHCIYRWSLDQLPRRSVRADVVDSGLGVKYPWWGEGPYYSHSALCISQRTLLLNGLIPVHREFDFVWHLCLPPCVYARATL